MLSDEGVNVSLALGRQLAYSITTSILAAGMLLLGCDGTAHAFLGFGSSQAGATSGLDLVQGYDRNTVTTLTGRVAASPDRAADPVVLELSTAKGAVVVVLGPNWYLQSDALDWKVGSSVAVRGSLAQGRDGRTYLLAQWVENPDGGTLVLRSATGRPGWSGGGGGRRSGGQGGMGGGSGQMMGGSGNGRMGR